MSDVGWVPTPYPARLDAPQSMTSFLARVGRHPRGVGVPLVVTWDGYTLANGDS
jgi:hypothetical protein